MEKLELLDLLYKLLTEQISEEEQSLLFTLFEDYLDNTSSLANVIQNL